jgi:hypothetical protein
MGKSMPKKITKFFFGSYTQKGELSYLNFLHSNRLKQDMDEHMYMSTNRIPSEDLVQSARLARVTAIHVPISSSRNM